MAGLGGLGALGGDVDDEPDRGISRCRDDGPETSEIGRSQGFCRSAKAAHRGPPPCQTRRASCGNIVAPPRTKYGMTTLGREEFASATVYQRLNSFQTSSAVRRPKGEPPPLPSKSAEALSASGRQPSSMGEKLKEMVRLGSSKELMQSEPKSGRADAAPSIGRYLLSRNRSKKESQRAAQKAAEQPPGLDRESRTTFAFSVEDDETTAAGDTPYAAARIEPGIRPRTPPRAPHSTSPLPARCVAGRSSASARSAA